MFETAAEFVFKQSRNGGPCLREGWGPLETDHTWSIAPESRLHIPLAPGQGDLLLQILLTPYTWRPLFDGQRLGVEVNGIALGEERIEAEAGLGYRLDAARFGNPDALDIRFHHPDAICPQKERISTDERHLGIALHEILVIRVPPERPTVARSLPPLPLLPEDLGPRSTELVQRLTGLAIPDLALRFESLGHNCEFGVVQRKLGVEPMGLLRFAGIAPHNLLRGLDFGFPQADDPDMLRVFIDSEERREYMIRNLAWGFQSHTDRYVGNTTADEVKQEQVRKHQLYLRKFLETLESGEKIFVFQHPDRLSEALVLPLLATLRSYGPNALLFVRRDSTRPPGTVEKLRPDLYMGSIDKLAPAWDVGNAKFTAWISLLANAYRFWREEGFGA